MFLLSKNLGRNLLCLVCLAVLCFACAAPSTASPAIDAATEISTATETVSLPTQTSKISEVSTPVATLDPIELQNAIRELMENCKLPCWWGITPGQSTFEATMNVLGPFNVKEFQSGGSTPLDFDPFGTVINGIDFGLISITFFVRQSIVEQLSIEFIGGARSDGSPTLLKTYSPSSIITNYGMPSQILVGLRSNPFEPASTWGYELWFVYELQGIKILYEGSYQLPTQGDNYITVCIGPATIDFVDIYLRPTVEKLEDLPLTKWGADLDLKIRTQKGDLLTWEQSTGTSLADFAQIFSQPVNNCFQSAVDLWP